MTMWSVTVTIYGGRTGTILDNVRTVYDADSEYEAVDQGIEKTLASFDYIGTKVVKGRVKKLEYMYA